MARLKVLTQGKALWARTIGSIAVGQAVDTVVVTTLAFGGSVPLKTLITLIVSGYGGKVLYEVLATPFTYAVVNTMKRMEGVDVFDTGTDFHPFHSSKR